MEKRDIVIIGAGGLGREVSWLIQRINDNNGPEWNILGFVDDGVEKGTLVQGPPVLGGVDLLLDSDTELSVVCAIANAKIKKRIIDKLSANSRLSFPNLTDPTAVVAQSARIGQGNIICAGTVLSVNALVEDFVLVDWNCTVGHETVIKSYSTLYPGVNVSGDVIIGEGTEMGTASCVIQGTKVGSGTIIGAGSVVIRNIPDNCTAVGNPTRIVKVGN